MRKRTFNNYFSFIEQFSRNVMKKFAELVTKLEFCQVYFVIDANT